MPTPTPPMAAWIDRLRLSKRGLRRTLSRDDRNAPRPRGRAIGSDGRRRAPPDPGSYGHRPPPAPTRPARHPERQRPNGGRGGSEPRHSDAGASTCAGGGVTLGRHQNLVLNPSKDEDATGALLLRQTQHDKQETTKTGFIHSTHYYRAGYEVLGIILLPLYLAVRGDDNPLNPPYQREV